MNGGGPAIVCIEPFAIQSVYYLEWMHSIQIFATGHQSDLVRTCVQKYRTQYEHYLLTMYAHIKEYPALFYWQELLLQDNHSLGTKVN